MGACCHKHRIIVVNSSKDCKKSITKSINDSPYLQNTGSKHNKSPILFQNRKLSTNKNNLHIVQKPSNFVIADQKNNENILQDKNISCKKNKTYSSMNTFKTGTTIEFKECRNSTVIFVGKKRSNFNSQIKQLTKTNRFNKLSQKELYSIFDFFNLHELDTLSKVSKIFHNIVRNPNLIKKFCIKSPEKSVTLPIQITYYSNNYNQQVSNLHYNLYPKFEIGNLKANIEIYKCVNPNTNNENVVNQNNYSNNNNNNDNSIKSMQSVVYIDPFTSKKIDFGTMIRMHNSQNSFESKNSFGAYSNGVKTPSFSEDGNWNNRTFENNTIDNISNNDNNKYRDEEIPPIIKESFKYL